MRHARSQNVRHAVFFNPENVHRGDGPLLLRGGEYRGRVGPVERRHQKGSTNVHNIECPKRREVDVLRREDRIRTHHMQGGSLSVRTDGKHGGRGRYIGVGSHTR